MSAAGPAAPVRFFDLLPPTDDAVSELRSGVAAEPPFIAPKFFYDTLGARLFEAICELPEYTLLRDEQSIFERRGAEIAAETGPGCTLIDLGAGSCAKAERLFSLLRPRQYVAVDIGAPYLRTQLVALSRRHPEVEVVGIAADFTNELELPPVVHAERRLAFYPGSSIGNFAPAEAVRFLARIRTLTAGGQLLLGADLAKDAAELVRAYDDPLGVTAAFNLNVLNVVNRVAGTDFSLGDWRHVALFNDTASRIEMHVEARVHVNVRWPGGQRPFAAGDRIHTENSYKATLPGLSHMLSAAGYTTLRVYTDAADRFALALAQ